MYLPIELLLERIDLPSMSTDSLLDQPDSCYLHSTPVIVRGKGHKNKVPAINNNPHLLLTIN